jgi:prepilin peptidase CpaA
MLATLLALGLVSVAAVTDARRHKIYNWNTYPGMCAAVWLNALGDVASWLGADPARLVRLGWIGTWSSLLGLLVCGLLMVVCFALFKIGGGDVKLMAMLGACLGPEHGLDVLLWTFVLGAALALVVLVWRVGPWQMLVRAVRPVLYVFGLAASARVESSAPRTPLFLAPAALVAVAIEQFSLIERLPSAISGWI